MILDQITFLTHNIGSIKALSPGIHRLQTTILNPRFFTHFHPMLAFKPTESLPLRQSCSNLIEMLVVASAEQLRLKRCLDSGIGRSIGAVNAQS